MRRMLLLPVLLLTSGLGLAACSSGSTTYPTASAPAPAAAPAEPGYPVGPPVSSTGPAKESGAPVRAPTTAPQ
jgi:hypothetical protein